MNIRPHPVPVWNEELQNEREELKDQNISRIQHPDHPLVAGSLPPLLLGALLADEPKFDQLKFPGFPPDPPQTQFTSIAANIQRLRTMFKAQPLTLNGPTGTG